MAVNKQMTVEVAYARADKQHIVQTVIVAGSTIEQAIMQSEILTLFPEIDLSRQKVGVFGKVKALTDLAIDGERIEIYRPLIEDPKIARRIRAKKP